MIAEIARLDQQTIALLQEQDALVQRYRALFALIDWTLVQTGSSSTMPTALARLPIPKAPTSKPF